ncbi:MAG: hypothetical protein Ta2F_01290 [Termitinemataceae bacterium]|nr:MAG: hypothetical protein Ta2F_01290 [Termitinemataceae bacterium]
MLDYPQGYVVPSRNVKDNSFKLIFKSNELFVEFLRDFVPVDILKNVSVDDIEDVTTNYPSLEHNEKSSDTVKKILLHSHNANERESKHSNIANDVLPVFVVALLEHQSSINFRMPYKLLFYMVSIWEQHEKEAQKNGLDPTKKDFKYPPILPLVFYDGTEKWTAPTNFLEKVELSDTFSQYTPKFEYELIDLNKYDKPDLLKFGDMLSLVLLVDKIRNPEDIKLFNSISNEYIKNTTFNVPENLKKLLADVIRALLLKINVPQEEIENFTEKINQRRSNIMFDFEGLSGYDVQETRRLVREETQQKERQKAAQKEKAIADYLRTQGISDELIKNAMSVQPK